MSSRNKTRVAAVLVGIATCVLSVWWSQAIIFATVLLLYVTLEYTLTTRDNLGLFRHQLERQEKVFLYFDLICKNGPLFVRVANLGMSNFLVTGINIRTQDLARFTYGSHQVVESGKSEEIVMPRAVCAGHPLSVDLEITLDYVGLDIRSKTDAKYFNVGMGLDDIPYKTTVGLKGLWAVHCPRCNLGGMLFMSTRNLTNFIDAEARKEHLLADLSSSCPNHASTLLMTMEDADAGEEH
jgi:hypothetical protein